MKILCITSLFRKNNNVVIFAEKSCSQRVKAVYLIKDTISFFDPDFHAKELTLMGSRNAMKTDFEYVIDCLEKWSH